MQRRVVVEPKVAAEPQHGRGHPPTVPQLDPPRNLGSGSPDRAASRHRVLSQQSSPRSGREVECRPGSPGGERHGERNWTRCRRPPPHRLVRRRSAGRSPRSAPASWSSRCMVVVPAIPALAAGTPNISLAKAAPCHGPGRRHPALHVDRDAIPTATRLRYNAALPGRASRRCAATSQARRRRPTLVNRPCSRTCPPSARRRWCGPTWQTSSRAAQRSSASGCLWSPRRTP